MSQTASSTPPLQTRNAASGHAKSPRQVKLQRIERTKDELLALQRQGYGIDDHFLNSLEYSKVQANAVILLIAGFIFFSSGLRYEYFILNCAHFVVENLLKFGFHSSIPTAFAQSLLALYFWHCGIFRPR